MRILKLACLLLTILLSADAKGYKVQKVKGGKVPKHRTVSESKKKKKDTKIDKETADFLSKNPCPSTGKSKGACPGYTLAHTLNIPEKGGGEATLTMGWKRSDGQ